ncbi:uncharacterized protein GGS22DRAFT_191604 [Annulohypoxylon maeteangense]|uniref:uncharacterized protein n=1 Tax=Annulohypoxylon maeteangense TaxID=1927788 RepID=UPI0020073638|nr:uncharacterized protein GGS22DRAFT_191604 [Annulohypoxylon maeteangense]KAI0881881.1 hypothetical protein GGS22DRAFT_191604 [Annulohypoxylon maeteangense]
MAHRRQRPQRRLLRCVSLLAIASTSSALNLSQFQVITSNQIPKKCIKAYSTDIEGCTRSDFTNGRQCSSSCVQGLEEVKDVIDDACEGLNVSAKSLLGIVLSGGLVDTLCPGFDTTTVTKTVQPSTTNRGFSTINPAPTTTSAASSKTSSTTSRKTTPTSDSSTIVQSTTNQETSPPSTTSEIRSTLTPSSTDPTSTQDTAQSAVTSAAQSTSSDDSGDDDPTLGGAGGGSPFDQPIESLGTTLRPGFCTEALTAVIFVAMFMLR